MKFVSRVIVAAFFTVAGSALTATAQTACVNCKPAAKTQVKTNYKYRTVQKVNNVTRYRNVQKTNNIYLVRNVQMTRVVRVTYVARVLGMKRVSQAEYMRLQRQCKTCRSVKSVKAVKVVKSKQLRPKMQQQVLGPLLVALPSPQIATMLNTR